MGKHFGNKMHEAVDVITQAGSINGMKHACVSHEGTQVDFYSDDEAEIEAVNRCFEYFWMLGADAGTREAWTMVSALVPAIEAVIDPSRLRPSKGLFKDREALKGEIGEKHFYAHKVQGVNCVTSFDAENKTTCFYREAEVSEHSYIRNLVREPMLARYKEAGFITIHASSCSINGHGILMPGYKGAGKSTLLSHLLDNGARFLANDAVLCERTSDQISIVTFPQCVRLSREIINNHRKLQEYFDKGGSYKFILDKYEFLPDALDEIYTEHHLSFRSSLKLVLLPALDISRKGFSLREADAGETMQLLGESLFYPYHHYVWSPFFDHLNDLTIDSRNYRRVFQSLPRVRRLDYGILDEAGRRALLAEGAAIVED